MNMTLLLTSSTRSAQINRYCLSVSWSFWGPLGPVAAKNVTEKKLDELRRFCSKVQHLNSHDGYYLLKNCFSLPKPMYLLGTYFFENKSFLEKIKTALRESLEQICNVKLDANMRQQSSFLVKMGGLGIMNATIINSAHICRL